MGNPESAPMPTCAHLEAEWGGKQFSRLVPSPLLSPEVPRIRGIKMYRPRLLWNLFWRRGPVAYLLTSKGTRERQLGTHVLALVSRYSAFFLPWGQRGAGMPPRNPICVPFLRPNLDTSAGTNSSCLWAEVLWQGSGAGREHEVLGKLEFQIFNTKYLSFVPEIKVFKFSLT